MEEKKEVQEIKSKEKENKGEKKEFNSVPFYLAGLLVVLALLVGFFVYPLILPVKAPVCAECPKCDTQIKPVKIILLYSDECKLCTKGNTILDSFTGKNVYYDVRGVSVESEEGKGFVQKYDIDSVPTALVNSEDIKAYPAISRALQEQGFVLKDGYYVVFEANLDPNEYRTRYYLNNECVNDENKLNVFLLDSPYDDSSIVYNEEIDSVLRDFKDEIDFGFVYVSTEKITEGNDLTSKYMYCADSMGKYSEFDNAVKAIYCGYDLNGFDLASAPYDPSLFRCGSPANKHLGQALKEGELVRAGNASGLVQSELEQCVMGSVNDLMPIPKSYFNNLRITRGFAALVGCRYLIPLVDMKKAICEMHPEFSVCSEAENAEGI
ncbi:MAG: hypothetical protein ABIA76_02915 [Candidatus Diapherotrites archaeon]